MKYYDKNKEFSYLKYWDVNNLHSWAMLQQHRVSNFVWIEDTSQFNEDFIKIIMNKEAMIKQNISYM